MRGAHGLVEPPEQTPEDRAVEVCLDIITEAVEDLVAMATGGQLGQRRRSYQGEEYDRGYDQGRKDAARMILISMGRMTLGPTTTERMGDRPPEQPTTLITPPGEE